MSDTEQYLIEIGGDLEAMSNDLLAKAVTIDTARDRERTTKKSSRS